LFICCFGRDSPQWARASSFVRFLDHTPTPQSRYNSSGRVISSSQKPLPDNTQHSQQTDIHDPVGIRTHNPRKRAASDLCLRPRGHWDRLILGCGLRYLQIVAVITFIGCHHHHYHVQEGLDVFPVP